MERAYGKKNPSLIPENPGIFNGILGLRLLWGAFYIGDMVDINTQMVNVKAKGSS